MGSPTLWVPQGSGDMGAAGPESCQGQREGKPPPAQNLEELQERSRGRLGHSATCLCPPGAPHRPARPGAPSILACPVGCCAGMDM